MEYVYPTAPPEALTLARRLDRAGYADTDHASTAEWLAALHTYEALMATATRRATFKADRRVDSDGVVLTGEAALADLALAELATRMAAFAALGQRVQAAVTYLDGLLDQYAALPTDPGTLDQAEALQRRYIGRRVRVQDGPAVTLADLIAEGWRLAVRCREGYRVLNADGQRAAVEAWGPFRDASGDGPLWHTVMPQTAILALDARAARLGVVTLASNRIGR